MLEDVHQVRSWGWWNRVAQKVSRHLCVHMCLFLFKSFQICFKQTPFVISSVANDETRQLLSHGSKAMASCRHIADLRSGQSKAQASCKEGSGDQRFCGCGGGSQRWLEDNASRMDPRGRCGAVVRAEACQLAPSWHSDLSFQLAARTAPFTRTKRSARLNRQPQGRNGYRMVRLSML